MRLSLVRRAGMRGQSLNRAAILGIAAKFIKSVSSVSAHKYINADRVTL